MTKKTVKPANAGTTSMTVDAVIQTAKNIISTHGPAPVLSSEDRLAFEELVAQLVNHVEPSGPIEEMWVYDIAVYTWEIIRLRRFKMLGLKLARKDGIAELAARLKYELISDVPVWGDGKDWGMWERRRILSEYAQNWFSDAATKRDLLDTLKMHNLTEEVIDTEAFRSQTEVLQGLEQMLISFETRRAAVLREISHHRETFARRAKKASDDFIEAESVPLSPEHQIADASEEVDPECH